MKIGAHVSTAGGIATAFERAAVIGAECVQIFESAPQQWGTARLDDAQVADFREKMAASGIEPVFIHGKYLMNLASADAKIFKTSTSTAPAASSSTLAATKDSDWKPSLSKSARRPAPYWLKRPKTRG